MIRSEGKLIESLILGNLAHAFCRGACLRKTLLKLRAFSCFATRTNCLNEKLSNHFPCILVFQVPEKDRPVGSFEELDPLVKFDFAGDAG